MATIPVLTVPATPDEPINQAEYIQMKKLWASLQILANAFGGVVATSNFLEGEAVPSAVAGANVASVTPNNCQHLRILNTVLFWGSIAVDPTLTATDTIFEIVPPIPSAFEHQHDAGGTAAAGTTSAPWSIKANPATGNLEFRSLVSSLSVQTARFLCAYKVIEAP